MRIKTMDLLQIIAQQTYTLSDLKRRARVLKEYLDKKAYGGALEIQSLEEDKTWIASIDSLVSQIDPKSVNKEISTLNDAIAKLTPITVYLAFEMPAAEMTKLTTEIRTILKSPTAFLDIKKDPNLLGGIAFVYKGVYKDYSLRKVVEDQKEVVLGEMRRYVS